jgi:crotonobetainyl-CoA:carnitine CoA-transferase CaiB-like acyl-CoA transferase
MPRVWRETEENPLWNYYRCKDDNWIMLLNIQPDRFWKPTCEALGAVELITDPRFDNWQKRRENCVELIKILDKIFMTKKREEWVDILSAHGSLNAPVLRLHEAVNHPQVIANKDIVEWEHPTWGKSRYVAHPVKFDATPATISSPAPMWSQHTEEVLTEVLGMSWDEIGKLKDSKTIA